VTTSSTIPSTPTLGLLGSVPRVDRDPPDGSRRYPARRPSLVVRRPAARSPALPARVRPLPQELPPLAPRLEDAPTWTGAGSRGRQACPAETDGRIGSPRSNQLTENDTIAARLRHASVCLRQAEGHVVHGVHVTDRPLSSPTYRKLELRARPAAATLPSLGRGRDFVSFSVKLVLPR